MPAIAFTPKSGGRIDVHFDNGQVINYTQEGFERDYGKLGLKQIEDPWPRSAAEVLRFTPPSEGSGETDAWAEETNKQKDQPKEIADPEVVATKPEATKIDLATGGQGPTSVADLGELGFASGAFRNVLRDLGFGSRLTPGTEFLRGLQGDVANLSQTRQAIPGLTPDGQDPTAAFTEFARSIFGGAPGSQGLRSLGQNASDLLATVAAGGDATSGLAEFSPGNEGDLGTLGNIARTALLSRMSPLAYQRFGNSLVRNILQDYEDQRAAGITPNFAQFLQSRLGLSGTASPLAPTPTVSARTTPSGETDASLVGSVGTITGMPGSGSAVNGGVIPTTNTVPGGSFTDFSKTLNEGTRGGVANWITGLPEDTMTAIGNLIGRFR